MPEIKDQLDVVPISAPGDRVQMGPAACLFYLS